MPVICALDMRGSDVVTVVDAMIGTVLVVALLLLEEVRGGNEGAFVRTPVAPRGPPQGALHDNGCDLECTGATLLTTRDEAVANAFFEEDANDMRCNCAWIALSCALNEC
eukprot:1031328_1